MEIKLNVMVIPEETNLARAWRLSGQLGEGGFAKVYLAQDKIWESAVVKLVPKEPGVQQEMLFEELDGAPNVMPILDRGEWGDYWVLVTPMAEKSLRDHLDETGVRLTVNMEKAALKWIARADRPADLWRLENLPSATIHRLEAEPMDGGMGCEA